MKSDSNLSLPLTDDPKVERASILDPAHLRAIPHGTSAGNHPDDKNNKAPTIHPHHCSKILFENEDSHSKTTLGSDSSLSLS